MPKLIVAASLLASDLSCIASEADRMTEAGADWLHLDIMDGHFVPNISFGPPVVKALRSRSLCYFDCHLMVLNPDMWVEPFKEAGANQVTFHWEAVDDVDHAVSLVKRLRDQNIDVGIAVSPSTPVEPIFPVVDSGLVSTVLIMTVKPGFGGQKFMPEMMQKVRAVRTLYPNVNIQVDGGLDSDTAKVAVASGANIIVAGTSLLLAEDPAETICSMRNC